MTMIESVSQCPGCGSSALAHRRGDPPWCTACEWNLGTWPEPKVKGRRRVIERNRRRAFELNRRLIAEFQGTLPGRPRRTRAGTVLAATSAALLLLDLLLVIGGGYLLVTASVPMKVVAVVLILIGIECRLRFHRFDLRYGAVSRTEQPELWSVIDAAQIAVGAPRVDFLVLTTEYNAACGRSGLRRRVVIELGMPLWVSLSPAARLALLGHELGHLVNHDPTTGFVTQPALQTLGRLADIFNPDGLANTRNAAADLLTAVLAYGIFFPIYHVCRWGHLALLRVAAEDHQRAEVYADALATKLGGSAGANELVQALLFAETVRSALHHAAGHSQDPAEWAHTVALAMVSTEPTLRVTEQSSLRYDVSRYLRHPPDGLRSRLVRSWQVAAPAIAIPLDALAAADRRLVRQYMSARRAIVRREF